MVELRDVCSGYGDGEVLHGINLSFEQGKITVIVGPNGCGKSTLLKSIIRINPHNAGEILVEGTSVEELGQELLAQKVAYLPQNKRDVDITVLRLVLHGRFPYLRYPRKYQEKDIEIAKSVLEWLEMAHLSDKSMSQLSGGVQQMVYIAMALAQNTPTILMDEPTVYLDVSHQMKLMDMARKLADSGKAVVMVLHDLTQALGIADRMVVMEEGKVVMNAEPEKIYKSGIIERVFGICVERTQTKNGWRYFYDKVLASNDKNLLL